MKKPCVLALLFISNLYGSQHFFNDCMQLWDRVDLIQAIHTTPVQREFILNSFLQDLERFTDVYENLMLSDEEKARALCMLEHIKVAYEHIFSLCDEHLYRTGSAFFENICKVLVTPIEVDTKGWPEHIHF